MGDGENYSMIRRVLEQNINGLQNQFHELNESNRSYKKAYASSFFVGAGIGASFGKYLGPEGLVAGTIVGGVVGGVVSVVGTSVSIFLHKVFKAKLK